MAGEDLTEKIVYPKNPKVKKAYISILGLIQQKKSIRLSVYECGEAICDYMGWIIDFDPRRSDKNAGPKYKEALRLMKALEDPFIFFPTPAPGIIEVCVYDIRTKRRVTNFDTLFGLFAEDIHASEFGGLNEELVFTSWNDNLHILDEDAERIIEESVQQESEYSQHSVPLITDSIKSEFSDEYRRNPGKVMSSYCSEISEKEYFSADVKG